MSIDDLLIAGKTTERRGQPTELVQATQPGARCGGKVTSRRSMYLWCWAARHIHIIGVRVDPCQIAYLPFWRWVFDHHLSSVSACHMLRPAKYYEFVIIHLLLVSVYTIQHCQSLTRVGLSLQRMRGQGTQMVPVICYDELNIISYWYECTSQNFMEFHTQ